MGQMLREGPDTFNPWGTQLLPLPTQDLPSPQIPSQMGQHKSSGCTWRVQLRGWHRMGSQITVRFWGQYVWGSLQGGTLQGGTIRNVVPNLFPTWPIPGSCRWSISCHTRVPSECHVPGAGLQRSRSLGPSSVPPDPWSWCPQRPQPPLEKGESLLHGTGWGCAPGCRHGARRLAPLEYPSSHANDQLLSMVRADEGNADDHSTHHVLLPGLCYAMPLPTQLWAVLPGWRPPMVLGIGRAVLSR